MRSAIGPAGDAPPERHLGDAETRKLHNGRHQKGSERPQTRDAINKDAARRS